MRGEVGLLVVCHAELKAKHLPGAREILRCAQNDRDLLSGDSVV
ncbi:MAG: hypothetical protein ACYTEL_11045 [Planctomycetota bacterium]